MYKIIGADGKEYGPISEAQLLQWYREGRVSKDTQVLREGAPDWEPLGQLPWFAKIMTPSLGNAPSPFYPQAPRTNGFAVASLVLGVISLPGCFCCSGLPFNLLGLIFSLVALSQIKHQAEVYGGKGMAIAGMICSIISLAMGFGFFALGMILNLSQL